MKKILILLPCILLLFLMSCDRRTSKKEHLKHAISEFNKNQKSIVINTYYPEHYTETKTDSIISNTFEVSLTNYTSDHNGILIKETTKFQKMTRQLHRVFACDLSVVISDKTIYKQHISAETFQDHNSSKFWNNATLEHVWVNQELSTSDVLSLGISFINPKNNAFKLYEMHIDSFGNERLILIEDHS